MLLRALSLLEQINFYNHKRKEKDKIVKFNWLYNFQEYQNNMVV